jgi:hypothetical protein
MIIVYGRQWPLLDADNHGRGKLEARPLLNRRAWHGCYRHRKAWPSCKDNYAALGFYFVGRADLFKGSGEQTLRNAYGVQMLTKQTPSLPPRNNIY